MVDTGETSLGIGGISACVKISLSAEISVVTGSGPSGEVSGATDVGIE